MPISINIRTILRYARISTRINFIRCFPARPTRINNISRSISNNVKARCKLCILCTYRTYANDGLIIARLAPTNARLRMIRSVLILRGQFLKSSPYNASKKRMTPFIIMLKQTINARNRRRRMLIIMIMVRSNRVKRATMFPTIIFRHDTFLITRYSMFPRILAFKRINNNAFRRTMLLLARKYARRANGKIFTPLIDVDNRIIPCVFMMIDILFDRFNGLFLLINTCVMNEDRLEATGR